MLRTAKRPAAAETGSAPRSGFQARDLQGLEGANGGSSPGNRCASSVLPAPGGPIISLTSTPGELSELALSANSGQWAL
jgi:hypothetical protein